MIAIISDVHGNYPALESVIEYCEKINVSHIYSLGDVCGYYSMINESIDLLRKYNVVHIVGNHDNYLINNIECSRSHIVNDCIRFQREIITEENFKWLDECEISLVNNNIHMVHGGWKDNLEEYIYNINIDYFSNFHPGFYFSGHTHIQQLNTFKNNFIYCNPGSVGQPRDNDSRTSFALFDGETINLIKINYNINKICDHMKKSGFTDHYYKNLLTGVSIIADQLYK